MWDYQSSEIIDLSMVINKIVMCIVFSKRWANANIWGENENGYLYNWDNANCTWFHPQDCCSNNNHSRVCVRWSDDCYVRDDCGRRD